MPITNSSRNGTERRRWPAISLPLALTALFAAACSIAETTHVVEPGQAFNAIVQDHCGTLEAADAVFEQNVGRPMPDGASFTDPETILPGQELVISCPNTFAIQSISTFAEQHRIETVGAVAVMALLSLALFRTRRDSDRFNEPTPTGPAPVNRPLVTTNRNTPGTIEYMNEQNKKRNTELDRKRSQQTFNRSIANGSRATNAAAKRNTAAANNGMAQLRKMRNR